MVAKKIADRSPKIRSALSTIEGRVEGDSRAGSAGGGAAPDRLTEILQRHGIAPDHLEVAQEEILEALGWYQLFKDAEIESPRSSVQKKELALFLDVTKEFVRHGESLAGTLRSQIAVLLARATGSDSLADLEESIAAAAALVPFLEKALARIPRDKGGRQSGENLKTLLLDVSVVWHKYSGGRKGLMRSGPKRYTSGYQYYGPLLDLVVDVLKLEKIRFHSKEAIGLQLQKVRPSVSRVEADQTQHRLAPKTDEGRISLNDLFKGVGGSSQPKRRRRTKPREK